jgi:hypothetical protein
MAKSEIIITQSPYGSGSAGVAVRGLDLYSVGSQAIVFTNSIEGNKNVTKWEWILVERPPGSAAILSGSDTREASIQADVAGRYVVSLRVNDLGDATPGYSITVAGVSYPVLDSSGGTDYGDWDLPAFREGVSANWTDRYGAGNPYGAQRELYRIISDLRELYISKMATNDKLAVNKVIKFNFVYVPLNNRARQTVTSTAYAATSPLIDFSDYDYGTVKFGAVLGRRLPTTVTAKLVDYTHSVDVANSEVSCTVVGPTTFLSSALTVGNAAGNIRLTPTAYRVYITETGSTIGHIYDAFLLLDA